MTVNISFDFKMTENEVAVVSNIITFNLLHICNNMDARNCLKSKKKTKRVIPRKNQLKLHIKLLFLDVQCQSYDTI